MIFDFFLASTIAEIVSPVLSSWTASSTSPPIRIPVCLILIAGVTNWVLWTSNKRPKLSSIVWFSWDKVGSIDLCRVLNTHRLAFTQRSTLFCRCQVAVKTAADCISGEVAFVSFAWVVTVANVFTRITRINFRATVLVTFRFNLRMRFAYENVIIPAISWKKCSATRGTW